MHRTLPWQTQITVGHPPPGKKISGSAHVGNIRTLYVHKVDGCRRRVYLSLKWQFVLSLVKITHCILIFKSQKYLAISKNVSCSKMLVSITEIIYYGLMQTMGKQCLSMLGLDCSQYLQTEFSTLFGYFIKNEQKIKDKLASIVTGAQMVNEFFLLINGHTLFSAKSHFTNHWW